jgi:hypothetical protein
MNKLRTTCTFIPFTLLNFVTLLRRSCQGNLDGHSDRYISLFRDVKKAGQSLGDRTARSGTGGRLDPWSD